MYHEERVIDGKLQWRGTPDGEFKPYGQRELTALILREREEHRKHQDALWEAASA